MSFDHEADMAGPHWQRSLTRRRVGDTVTYTIRRHDQHWRAANDNPLGTARNIWVAVSLGVVCWLVLGALTFWFVELSAQ